MVIRARDGYRRLLQWMFNVRILRVLGLDHRVRFLGY
jgi:hypothetical protein